MSAVIVLATRNQGKIAEFSALLASAELAAYTIAGLDAFPAIGEIAETGNTFEENARIKARTVMEATGHIAVADDSGLEVDALDGAPGVFSARYSGKGATDAANNSKLLRALEAVPADRRTARFCCVMIAQLPDGTQYCGQGSWEGSIAFEARGSQGFGYDPVFIDAVTKRHAAELSREEKNARSHRAQALAMLLQHWQLVFASP